MRLPMGGFASESIGRRIIKPKHTSNRLETPQRRLRQGHGDLELPTQMKRDMAFTGDRAGIRSLVWEEQETRDDGDRRIIMNHPLSLRSHAQVSHHIAYWSYPQNRAASRHHTSAVFPEP